MEEALNVQSKTTIPHQPSGLDGKAPNSSYNQQQPRSNNSPYHPYDSDATQKFSYGGQYLGGSGGAQPRLPLVSGIPGGPNPQLAGTPNQQLYSYPGAQYFAAPGNLPPGSVAQFQPRAAQATYGGFRQASPYSPYPIPQAPVVYFQQQQKPTQQQAQQPQQQQAQPSQQPQSLRPDITTGSGGGRRQRSSAIRIVDLITNRDIITGELVPPESAESIATDGTASAQVNTAQPQKLEQTQNIQVITEPLVVTAPHGDLTSFKNRLNNHRSKIEALLKGLTENPVKMVEKSPATEIPLLDIVPQIESVITNGDVSSLISSVMDAVSTPPSAVSDDAFVDQHKELEFNKANSSSRSTGGFGKANATGKPDAPTASALIYREFQHSLKNFLRGNKCSTEEVSGWIQNQPVEVGNPLFIRALSTAVTESSIDGNGTDSKLNTPLLKDYSEVLRRFVENVAERELQLLFAVQTLVTQRQHPKGLIQGIFETLYDGNVVSEEGFESWVTSEEPSEREGKAVALKSIASFLIWLKEADPESDYEADLVFQQAQQPKQQQQTQPAQVSPGPPVLTVAHSAINTATGQPKQQLKPVQMIAEPPMATVLYGGMSERHDVSENPANMVDNFPLAEKWSANIVATKSVIANRDKDVLSSMSSVVMDVELDDGEDRSGGKSSSLRYPYKDDQWSPVNPSGKKVYDRNFLVELKNNPASMKKPEGLPGSWILQVIREKSGAPLKRVPMESDFTPPFLRIPAGKPQGLLPKRSSQQETRGEQGVSRQGQERPQMRKEIKLPSMSTLPQDLPENLLRASSRAASNTVPNQETMDLYLRTLDHIVNEVEITNRVRFIIKDLIDLLRKTDWKSHSRDENIEKEIYQIRKVVDHDERERDLGSKPKLNEQASRSQSNWRKKSESIASGNVYFGERTSALLKSQTLVEGDKRDKKDPLPHSKELLDTSNVSTFIGQCLVLENNREERRATGTLLKKMIRTKRFTANHILEGFQEVLQGAEQSFIDIPKLWEYLAQLIQPIFEEGIVDIRFLGTLAGSLNPSLTPHFVAATLKELVNAQGGIAGVERLLILSNSSVNSLLPGADANAFINQNKELEFLLKIISDYKNSSSLS